MSEIQTIVLKFGGTSVSSKARWDTIQEVAQAHIAQNKRPFIVCSAVSGVSNILEALLPAAVRGDHEPMIAELYKKHEALATELGVDLDALIGADLKMLERIALGSSLIKETSPKLQALVMAQGELMATKLGAAYLNAQGLKTQWSDARQMLKAIEEDSSNDQRHYLSSPCDFAPDAALQAQLKQMSADEIVLTQGFIAYDEDGETVLLGRGGSDTSAAYFAAKLNAQCLEIWTDVPGMFTADPRQVPGARLLRRLDYFEAQELATTGAKVLHPRCIDPVRRYNIPLHIRCTQSPQMEGTVITSEVPDFGPQVKAISTKKNLPLVSMETVGMWQQVGFLADVFGHFKRHGLSIDLIATSETNITVSLDPVANALDKQQLQHLIVDLTKICQAKQLGPCAAVSLVGRNIRAILHKLGPIFEVFEEQKVYMMSQASSDLNLTFVVNEDQVERLVRTLHAALFGDRQSDELFGPSWRELFSAQTVTDDASQALPWWVQRRQELLDKMQGQDGARYVYDAPSLNKAIDRLAQIESLDARYYAIKANPNPQILNLFATRGMRFECVSVGELEHVLTQVKGVKAEQLLFTPNFAPIHEYKRAFELGVTVTLDNLHPLQHHPEVFRDKPILVRVDPGIGKGHHKHVRTAGQQSKFGVEPADLPQLLQLAAAVNAKVIGLHAHVGSGIRAPETWSENALFLASIAATMPDVRILNLGGGLGIPEKPGDAPLDMNLVAQSLHQFKLANPQYELWMEPGRYCVASAGVLLARVTQIKGKGEHRYVGIETGMNSLIRPSLYGAYHFIANLSSYGQPTAITADVVGPICESGDVLGFGRRLPETREGDVIAIATAGAYGRAMSSGYNMREPAGELILE